MPQSTIVQSWRGTEGAAAAAELGMDTICSACQFVYFDYPQSDDEPSVAEWFKTTTIETVYSFDPTPDGLSRDLAAHVLGSECTMWTEHAPQERVDHQLFPRLCAFIEVLWSSAEARDWDDFQQRLGIHYKRLDALGVKYFQGTRPENPQSE